MKGLCISQPCSLRSDSVADLRGSDRTAGWMWVYFHAILVGETWPAFQSTMPDGGSNLRGKGGEKRKQAWLRNAKTRWEDVTQIMRTHTQMHKHCSSSKSTLSDVLLWEPRYKATCCFCWSATGSSFNMEYFEHIYICSSHMYDT